MPRLRRSNTSDAGLTRRRRGRGFEYLDADGARVEDPAALQRIKDLAIPPAWEEVWICPDPMGHLQATGIDAAGRRQYLYHERWRTRRAQQKFDHVLEFAAALPRLRLVVAEHLEATGLERERVLACAVRLLDRGFFRIGSESYAEDNGSFGLATIRKRHVRVNGTSIAFDYTAKGGKRRVLELVDPEVIEVVRALKRRGGGGAELLAYKDGRRWRDVRSSDINAYIKEAGGGDYTAKDFRTWQGTVLAAVYLAAEDRPRSRTAAKRVISATVKQVAGLLGNTPAVARSSYIDPRVFDRFAEGVTIAPALEDLDPERLTDPDVHGIADAAVLELLDGAAGTARAA